MQAKMWFYLVSIITSILFYYWATRTHNYWKKRGVPYVKPTALFGNLFPFVSRQENYNDFLRRIYKSLNGHAYGGYFEMREPIMMIRDPNLINLITIKNFNNFQDRAADFILNADNRELNPLSGHLIAIKGERWRNIRQKLSPVFTSNKLNVMYEQVLYCVTNLDKLITEKNGCDLEMRQIFTNYVIDVIGLTAFGITCSSVEENQNSKFCQMALKSFQNNNYSLRFLLMTINKKLIDIFKIPDMPNDVSEFFYSIIKNTIRYRQEANIQRKDVLQMLMDLMNQKHVVDKLDEFDEIDVAANAFAFFIGGFETTASTLTYVAYELSIHKIMQERMREEVSEVKKKFGGKLIIESLKELNYMDMVISETLRKYPPIPALFRICTETYEIPGTNTIIEKGTKVIIPTQGIHYDPLYYPDPEEFDPERFSSENKLQRPSCSYFPFGEGPRYCIGVRFAQIQMKFALAMLVSNYELKTCKKTEVPLTFRKGVPLLVTKYGVWLNIEKISENF